MEKSMKIMMTLLALLLTVGMNAQKVDQRLTRLVEKSAQRRAQGVEPLDPKAVNKTIAVIFNADSTIAAFSAIAMLKEGAECPTARLEQMGVKVRYQIGRMVALIVPANRLQALEEVEEISYVKADEMMQPMNNLARKETKAEQIVEATKAAAAGLPQAYTGKGVIVGIIDQGIDFNHAAFRHADGSTRIVQGMMMLDSEGNYMSYPSSAVEGIKTDNMMTSHGTHTAATAAGSALGNGQQGVAPEAELFLCGLDEYTSTTFVGGCIKRIFAYADHVNKPAVVSISMGSIVGLHDGSNDIVYAVKEMTENGTKQGRVVLVSSGNAGANSQSISQSGTTKTVLGSATKVTATDPAVYSGLYTFYASDYEDFSIDLKVVDTTTGQVSDMGNHVLHQKSGAVMNLQMSKFDEFPTANPDKKAVLYILNFQDMVVKLDDPKYRLAIVATAKEGQTLKMVCNGDDYAEPCFNAPTDTGGYDFAANGWTKGYGDVAFNSSICSDAVISVGSYMTRPEWTTWENNVKKYQPSTLTGKTQQIGEISDFSSWGIDDNNKTYPTIIAPGQGIISAANNYDLTIFTVDLTNPDGAVPDPQSSEAKNYLIENIDLFGRRNWYVLEQGTSMSCPHAAGIIALWLQAKPTLTTNEIKSVLKETCINDTWTTDVANIPSGNKIQAGYGKIDALAGLKKILGVTAIDAVAMDGHRQATPATMYSVDAPVYNMMGQQVDKAHRGFVIYKGRKYLNK
jgi:subtilisin family serine protease